MSNPTQFLLSEAQAGVGLHDQPSFFRVRQNFPRPLEADLGAAVRRELTPLLAKMPPGGRIAITAGSRGVSNISAVLAECVFLLKEHGAEPFIVPAMGSHGGATAEGQLGVLETLGVTEAAMGCPIRSSMEVIQVGTTETGFPVFQDRNASEADGVLVVNRVKPHTMFVDRVESGLCKMMVIGLGKQAGASKIHQQALKTEMGRMILEATRILLAAGRPRFVGGLALVENAYKDTAIVKGLSMENTDGFIDAESALLKRAYQLMARLPFDHLDGLIVDEMGKNISGSGMDTNVTGKKDGMVTPSIGAIYVRSLTPETKGNATGVGFADVIPRRMFSQIDLNATYMNAFTAKRLQGGKIPLLAETELQAMQVLLGFRQAERPQSARLAWIRNTSQLAEFWVSTALQEEVLANNTLEILAGPLPLVYDGDHNMIEPRLEQGSAAS